MTIILLLLLLIICGVGGYYYYTNYVLCPLGQLRVDGICKCTDETMTIKNGACVPIPTEERDIPNKIQFIRIERTPVDGEAGSLLIKEIEIFNKNNENIAAESTISVNGIYGDQENRQPRSAFDGDTTTDHVGLHTTHPGPELGWAEMDFESEMDIRQIKLFPWANAGDTANNSGPKRITGILTAMDSERNVLFTFTTEPSIEPIIFDFTPETETVMIETETEEFGNIVGNLDEIRQNMTELN